MDACRFLRPSPAFVHQDYLSYRPVRLRNRSQTLTGALFLPSNPQTERENTRSQDWIELFLASLVDSFGKDGGRWPRKRGAFAQKDAWRIRGSRLARWRCPGAGERIAVLLQGEDSSLVGGNYPLMPPMAQIT